MRDTDWAVVDITPKTVEAIGSFFKGIGFYHEAWMPECGWIELEPHPERVYPRDVARYGQFRMAVAVQNRIFASVRIAEKLAFEAYSGENPLRWWWQIADGVLQFSLYENDRELKCIHRLIPIR